MAKDFSIPENATVEQRADVARLNNEFEKEAFWRRFDAWLFAGAIALVIATYCILGYATNAKLIDWVEKYNYPLITLIIGYLLAKNGKTQTPK